MTTSEPAADENRYRTIDRISWAILIGIPVISFVASYVMKDPRLATDGHVGAFSDGGRFAKDGAFPWAIIGELAFVVYAYSAAVKHKEYGAALLSLTVWIGEIIWEMVNGLVRHFHCYPLFGFQGQTAWQMYPGLTIEISLMFAVVPLVLFNLLPKEPKDRIGPFQSRLLVPFLLGLLCIVVEWNLNSTGALVWTWFFWKKPLVGVVMSSYYVPFLVMAWAHDRWKDDVTKCGKILGGVVALFVICHFALPHSDLPVSSCPDATRSVSGLK